MQPTLEYIMDHFDRHEVGRDNLTAIRRGLPPEMARALTPGQNVHLRSLMGPDRKQRRLLIIHPKSGAGVGRALFEEHPGSQVNGVRVGRWLGQSRRMIFDGGPPAGLLRPRGATPCPYGIQLVPANAAARPAYDYIYLYQPCR